MATEELIEQEKRGRQNTKSESENLIAHLNIDNPETGETTLALNPLENKVKEHKILSTSIQEGTQEVSSMNTNQKEHVMSGLPLTRTSSLQEGSGDSIISDVSSIDKELKFSNFKDLSNVEKNNYVKFKIAEKGMTSYLNLVS